MSSKEWRNTEKDDRKRKAEGRRARKVKRRRKRRKEREEGKKPRRREKENQQSPDYFFCGQAPQRNCSKEESIPIEKEKNCCCFREPTGEWSQEMPSPKDRY